MSFSCPELSLAEILTLARRFGYDGIEARMSADHKHGVEVSAFTTDRERIKLTVAQSGVALCCLATSCSYADPEKRKENLKMTLRAIDLAGDLGTPCIRVFGGRIPEGIDRAAAIAALIEALGSVADHAEERGVTVCMETHDDWCDPAHVAAVMQGVDRPGIAVNWDIMHPIRRGGATMDSAFQTLKPWIRHVHFHDGTIEGNLQMTPIGEGAIDHLRAVELLTQLGYEGYMSGEWINWEPYETHLPRELATMRQYEADTALPEPPRPPRFPVANM